MWFSFMVALFACAVLVYLPGALQLRCFGFRGPEQIALSPILSVSELVIIGIAFTSIGVSGPLPVVLAIAVSTAMIMLAGNIFIRDNRLAIPGLSWCHFCIYIVVGIALGFWYFVWNLDGPGSFVQEFDNAYHLNLITKFIESGCYSSLHASIFSDDMSYYPAAFHVVAALVGSLTGTASSLAENTSIFVFAFCVFPGSMYLFLAYLFKGERLPILLGSLVVLAFSAFPWGFLVAGPLYSNMAALAVLPALMSAFMQIFEEGSRCKKISYALIVFAGLAYELFAQPNAVFTAIVVLSPFMAQLIIQKLDDRKYGVVASVAFVMAAVIFLLVCYKLPFLSSVTHYNCIPYTGTAYQAAIDFADFGYRNTVAQPVLSILALLGILAVLAKKRLRWILFPLLFFFVGYVVAGCKGPSFFTGFWYNDVDRIAANAVLLLIPLATIGFAFLIKVLISLIEQGIGPVSRRWCVTVISAAVCLGVFCPSHIDAGNGYVNTAFGDRASRLDELAKSAVSLTADEKEFLLECKDVVGEEPALNVPYDGSVFAYSICGLRTEYTQFFSSKDEECQVVQHKLNCYVDDPDAKNALESLGVSYYLKLDEEDDPDSTFYDAFFKKSEWDGMLAVDDSTPGFEVVLSRGDMRLYRISQL